MEKDKIKKCSTCTYSKPLEAEYLVCKLRDVSVSKTDTCSTYQEGKTDEL